MATPRQHATSALVTVIVAYALIPASIFAPPWGPYEFDNTGAKYTLWGACALLTVAFVLANVSLGAAGDTGETEEEKAARRKRAKRIIFWSLFGYPLALAMWVLCEFGAGLAAAGA